MLNLYITKVLDDALLYIDLLNSNVIKRINKNKKKLKQKQMITAELLLNYALRDSGYQKEIKTDYLPKLILKDSNLWISKSHSHDYVLVAVSNSNVGCDLEKIRDIKTPSKLLSAKELENYNSKTGIKQKEAFTMYWTAKESFIKYHGSLTKDYKDISFKVETTLNNFNGGKIDDLFCYQSFFKDYSFAVVTSKFIAPEVLFVTKDDMKREIKR